MAHSFTLRDFHPGSNHQLDWLFPPNSSSSPARFVSVRPSCLIGLKIGMPFAAIAIAPRKSVSSPRNRGIGKPGLERQPKSVVTGILLRNRHLLIPGADADHHVVVRHGVRFHLEVVVIPSDLYPVRESAERSRYRFGIESEQLRGHGRTGSDRQPQRECRQQVQPVHWLP